MKDYSDKYSYVHFNNAQGNPVTIAISTYEGKTVKGYAKCDVSNGDIYNEQAGEELAAARCNARIAQKRARRAKRKLLEAQQQFLEAQKHLTDMTNYYGDSVADAAEAQRAVNAILSTL